MMSLELAPIRGREDRPFSRYKKNVSIKVNEELPDGGEMEAEALLACPYDCSRNAALRIPASDL